MDRFNSNFKTSKSLSLSYYMDLLIHNISLPSFIIISLILITLSKTNHTVITSINHAIISASLPIVRTMQYPINLVTDMAGGVKNITSLKNENSRLREENGRLRSIYLSSLHIKHENEELRKLLGSIRLKVIHYRAVNLIGSTNSAYSKNIIIDSGSRDGIKRGQIITGSKGVIGRVLDVMEDKSKVLLITDINSHIPIITSKSRTRGVLAGNNSATPHIIYLDDNHTIQKGDYVFTSGDGGILPPGLFIGIIKSVDKNSAAVKTVENANSISTVAVVLYE